MTPFPDGAIESARAFGAVYAGGRLLPSHARLYSEFTRLRAGQKGLPSWTPADAAGRLDDATRLIQAALVAKDSDLDFWRPATLRAAELLEWLALPLAGAIPCPATLLSAALYQLAGYPARAFGLLGTLPGSGQESDLLRCVLKGDFPALFRVLASYWATPEYRQRVAGRLLNERQGEAFDSDRFPELLTDQTAACLGVLAASMRWGDDGRLESAADKLSAIAGVLLHSTDRFGWLLARLCSQVVQTYARDSLRARTDTFREKLSAAGRAALESYLRLCYTNVRTLAWPAQVRGIAALLAGESFALCTPTGSGKTAIAELAIIQGLFGSGSGTGPPRPPSDGGSLVLYLTPSRALAAEVEARLGSVLRRLSDEPVIVTGLYGGTDWGPTDAWLTSQDRAVLICTYEKAEALLHFLGPLFLNRVALVIIDEAHKVQPSREEVGEGVESRELSLEALVMRLTSYLDVSSRVVALSAVAAGVENVLAQWVARRKDASAIREPYRSTRQLIGRLEYSTGRHFEIRYDLLDSRPLQFREGSSDDTPYIRQPFPPHPPAPAWEEGGPEKRLRPATLWAAMHLAAKGVDGRRRPVLVFAAQHPEWYAKDFLELLEATWLDKELPDFFEDPSDSTKTALWQECLATCQDYFGSNSYEYRLLQRGIVLHHGKMPGRMARLLVEVVTDRIVSLVVATSTLSEGVNLPFELVLLPTLARGQENLDVREFANLAGRAGRPGSGTEGQALVLLGPGSQRTRALYQHLIRQLVTTGADVPLSTGARSSLAELIRNIERQWSRVSGSTDEPAFLAWLETTAPIRTSPDDAFRAAALTLDSLDKILVASVSETEALAGRDLSPTEVEERLRDQWQRSYAHYASAEEARLANLFVARGKAVRSRIYERAADRRRLYMTSLAPRAGTEMLRAYPEVRALLETGRDYALWNPEQRFQFIRSVVERLVMIPGFELRGKPRRSWEATLRWWLDASGGPRPPNEAAVLSWYDFVSKNFIYRFSWALGSIIGLAVNEVHSGELRATSLQEWPQTGLPWAVFWMKELVTWGTLEPVAAYLLSQRVDLIRVNAETRALDYYRDVALADRSPDDRLGAARIRDWVLSRRQAQAPREAGPTLGFDARLVRDFKGARQSRLRVVPVATENEIHWVDPGGYPLAVSARPTAWQSGWLDTHDFTLDSERGMIEARPFLLQKP